MLTLTLADFMEYLQQPFQITAGSTTLTLVLTEARPITGGRPGDRQPFSLIFRGPPQPILPQAIYDFPHPKHGVLGIFIVPVGADAPGATYEAIFS
jgi:hypothetical protein